MNSFNDQIDQMKAKCMAMGEAKHGPLDLARDPRDFIEESVEELVDFLNYWEFSMLQGRIGFCKWFSIDRDVRFIIWRIMAKEECQNAKAPSIDQTVIFE